MSNLADDSFTGVSLSTTGELTVIVLVMTFLLFAMTLIFYFRARRYVGITDATHAGLQSRRGRRRLMFAPNRLTASLYRPLDPSVLKSLSVTAFRCEDRDEDQGGGLDCAVCLSELAEGEEARLLPRCSHWFHVECIDMWFRSNSTCPLCRLPVGPSPVVEHLSRVIPLVDRGSSSATGSSSGERETGMLAIDVIPTE